MADQYPQIGANAFAQGCEYGRTTITEFYKTLYNRLNLNPDERGLTDQLLFQLVRAVPSINVHRSTVDEEVTAGYDYSWQFSAINPQTKLMQQRWIFLQAKNYKPQTFGGQIVEVADFTYQPRNSTTMQMDLLEKHITAIGKQHPKVVVTGGYLCYGRSTVQFVPIADVLAAYKRYNVNGAGKAAINRAMSTEFLRAGEAHYNIQNLLTYGSK